MRTGPVRRQTPSSGVRLETVPQAVYPSGLALVFCTSSLVMLWYASSPTITCKDRKNSLLLMVPSAMYKAGSGRKAKGRVSTSTGVWYT